LTKILITSPAAADNRVQRTAEALKKGEVKIANQIGALTLVGHELDRFTLELLIDKSFGP